MPRTAHRLVLFGNVKDVLRANSAAGGEKYCSLGVCQEGDPQASWNSHRQGPCARSIASQKGILGQ